MNKYAVCVAALIAGCAGTPEPARRPDPLPWPAPAARAEPAPRSESIAVASLMRGARAEVAAGRLAHAAAALERALRIEPRNPRLWQELARVRLKQAEYAQAEGAAARSNAWAGTDNGLRADNWRLIAQAREARGDREGARAALEFADRIAR